jgi:hypothetical protein
VQKMWHILKNIIKGALQVFLLFYFVSIPVAIWAMSFAGLWGDWTIWTIVYFTPPSVALVVFGFQVLYSVGVDGL